MHIDFQLGLWMCEYEGLMYQNSRVCKKYAESLYCILVYFKDALLLSFQLSVCLRVSHLLNLKLWNLNHFVQRGAWVSTGT